MTAGDTWCVVHGPGRCDCTAPRFSIECARVGEARRFEAQRIRFTDGTEVELRDSGRPGDTLRSVAGVDALGLWRWDPIAQVDWRFSSRMCAPWLPEEPPTEPPTFGPTFGRALVEAVP